MLDQTYKENEICSEVSLTLQNIKEGYPAEGGPRAVSQDVEGEELPGQQGLHQQQNL